MKTTEYTKLRAVWRQMHRRCSNPKDVKYYRYGARGIKVCSEWASFDAFYAWASAAGYRIGLTIDRQNNDGPYSPDNCRWVTHQGQQGNRSDHRMLTAFGETKHLAEWARDPRCKVSAPALYLRVVRRKWGPERALTEPTIMNNAQATHCPQGHEYTPENISWDGPDRTWRKCKACMRDRATARYARRKGPAGAG